MSVQWEVLKHRNTLGLKQTIKWVCVKCGNWIRGQHYQPLNPNNRGHYCGINGCKGEKWKAELL